MRCYDVSQLSMKFDRHLVAEVVDFQVGGAAGGWVARAGVQATARLVRACTSAPARPFTSWTTPIPVRRPPPSQILTEDYSKAVFLCADRSLAFHARFGGYYRTRIPKHGRDLAYCPFSGGRGREGGGGIGVLHTVTSGGWESEGVASLAHPWARPWPPVRARAAELLVGASAPEVYRMSLSEGRFLTPLPSRSPAVNACGVSPAHGLLACAGEDGVLECFDLRQRGALGWLDAAAAAGGAGQVRAGRGGPAEAQRQQIGARVRSACVLLRSELNAHEMRPMRLLLLTAPPRLPPSWRRA